ncbi:uncharacterized protein LOC135202764 [Macrobrachium nipponense]|uniref:uncharacterized protein LOC135202764 n=1 Tax=Macrobrachium nipponense TaxID=159736 RepID=UPI0030C86B02
MGTSHHRTAYNPTANGIVERFHHSLKASLMASCAGNNWKMQLPWVLLSPCTAPRANGEASHTEKVYKETLPVPGEFFPSSTEDIPNARLQESTGKFPPCLKTFSDRASHFRPKSLETSKNVFVCHDVYRPPLTRPCRGLFPLLHRSEKAYLLCINGREDWVSIDRLKPAFLTEEGTTEDGPTSRPRTPPEHLPSPEIPRLCQRRRGHPKTAVEPPRIRSKGGILPLDPRRSQMTRAS